MKESAKIYTEYCIRDQIAAGGSGDWQIRLGKYIVSLQYVDCPGDGCNFDHYDHNNAN